MLAHASEPLDNDAEMPVSQGEDDEVPSVSGGGAPYGAKSGHRITPQQKAFARAFVLESGNATEAAKIAGYASPQTSGSKLMVHPGVMAEVKRLSVFNIEAELPQLIARGIEIAKDPKTPKELAVRTIFGLMDRVGLRPKSGPLVQINDNSVHNTDARQVTMSPQDVLRQLDAQRERRMSGISASMTDNPPQYDALPEPPAEAQADPTQGGGVDQGPCAGPSSLPGTSDADTAEPGEKP